MAATKLASLLAIVGTFLQGVASSGCSSSQRLERTSKLQIYFPKNAFNGNSVTDTCIELVAPPNSRIKITATNYNRQANAGGDCDFSFIEVKDGASMTSSTLQRWCLNDPGGSVETSSQHCVVRMRARDTRLAESFIFEATVLQGPKITDTGSSNNGVQKASADVDDDGGAPVGMIVGVVVAVVVLIIIIMLVVFFVRRNRKKDNLNNSVSSGEGEANNNYEQPVVSIIRQGTYDNHPEPTSDREPSEPVKPPTYTLALREGGERSKLQVKFKLPDTPPPNYSGNTESDRKSKTYSLNGAAGPVPEKSQIESTEG